MRLSQLVLGIAVLAGGSASAQIAAVRPYSIVDTADRGPLSPERPGGSQNVTAPLNYQIRYIELTTSTGWPERVLYVVPRPTPTTKRPLLVVFHKFGSTEKDITAHTTLAQEAGNRGWYAVCPLAAYSKHFASLESQINTEFVLEWMLGSFPKIDEERIYGIGFSMGGGAVSNYAARHLDPARPMLAALIDLCGGVALKDTYLNDPPARVFLDFWFGNGSPSSATPFKLARSSVVNFHPVTAQVYVGEDLARNLLHLPLQIQRASGDPISYLPRQSDVFAAHLQSLGPSPAFSYQIVPPGVLLTAHDWSLLDGQLACDWLSQFTLDLPKNGKTLADHNGVYFHFFVTQDTANAFTPFTWVLDLPNNQLRLSATANLKRLRVDLLGSGLSSGSPLKVRFGTADGHGDQVVLTPWPSPPAQVKRDGTVTQSWSYGAASKELTLIELDGAVHDWTVTP